MGRTRLSTEERRSQLLLLGRRAFAERAYEDVALDDIAVEAGVTRTLVYHYFPTKRAFYLATVRAASDELRSRTAPDPSLPADQRLRARLDGFLDYISCNGSTFRTLLRSAAGADPEVADVASETRALLMARVLEGLAIDVPSPALRIALRGWLGFVEAAILEWIETRDLERSAMRDLLAASLASIVAAATG